MTTKNSASIIDSEFNWPVRIYYEDTDAAGVVYHSNYLKYMERARTEWLRATGFSHEKLREQEGIIFVVTNMTISFEKPACIDEQIEVLVRLTKTGGASLQFEQIIIDGSEEMICRADVNVACLDSETMKPKRIPNPIKVKLTHVD